MWKVYIGSLCAMSGRTRRLIHIVWDRNSHRDAQTYAVHPDVMLKEKIGLHRYLLALLAVYTDEYTLFRFQYALAAEIIINAFFIVIYKRVSTAL